MQGTMPDRAGANTSGIGFGVSGEHLFLALQMRAVGRFFWPLGAAALRLTSNSRAEAGLELRRSVKSTRS